MKSLDQLGPEEAAALAATLARGRRPGVAVPDAEFLAHLSRHLDADAPLVQSLLEARVADLHLAFGCVRHDPCAMALFESEILSQLKNFLARLKQPDAFVDDLAQLLREQLYLGERPKLLDYSGRGSLLNWMRVLAMRTAIDVLRKRSELLRDANDILEDVAQTAGSDPELAFIRNRCRQHFAAALEAAVASLSDEERMLLRLHFLEGVSLDELAPILRVHRTTVARRIAAARRQLIEDGRRHLSERLALSPSELESMMRLMTSQLDLSLKGILKG